MGGEKAEHEQDLQKFSWEKAEKYANNWRGLRAEGVFYLVLKYMILIPYNAVTGWHPQAKEWSLKWCQWFKRMPNLCYMCLKMQKITFNFRI